MKFDILDGRIYPLLFNEGKVLARHVRCRYFIPCHFLHSEFIKAPTIKSLDSGWEHDYFSFDCHNDIGVIHSGLHFELPNHAISPGLEGYIDNNIGFGRPIKSGGPFIKWQVYADNADPVFGETGLEHCLTGFKNKLPM